MSGGAVEEFARLIVSGACRGNAYVKFPSWYDVFLLYRVFAPNVLNWAFRLLISPQGTRRTSSYIGTGRSLDIVDKIWRCQLWHVNASIRKLKHQPM